MHARHVTCITSTKRKRKQNNSMQEVHGRGACTRGHAHVGGAASRRRDPGEVSAHTCKSRVHGCRSQQSVPYGGVDSTSRCETAGSRPDDDAFCANALPWLCLGGAPAMATARRGGAGLSALRSSFVYYSSNCNPLNRHDGCLATVFFSPLLPVQGSFGVRPTPTHPSVSARRGVVCD
jgi:hypothetical protein